MFYFNNNISFQGLFNLGVLLIIKNKNRCNSSKTSLIAVVAFFKMYE